MGALAALVPAAHAATGAIAPFDLRPTMDPRDPVPAAFAQPGIRVGALVLEPRLTLLAGIDDNVFAREGNPQADLFADGRLSAFLHSDWSRHAVAAYAEGGKTGWADHHKEGVHRWLGETSARLDLSSATAVAAGVLSQADAEPRTAASTLSEAVEPVRYRHEQAWASVARRDRRIDLYARAAWNRYDFDDVGLAGGGIADQDDRNRDVASAIARAGYVTGSGAVAFVGMKANQRDYDDVVPGGIERDSDGYTVQVGVRAPPTALIRFEIAAGWLSQTYDDAAIDAVDGPGIDAAVDWSVTGLSTIRLVVANAIEDAAVAGAAGYRATDTALTLDHELLRNLTVSFGIRYADDDYQGLDRRDRKLGGECGATWYLDRTVHVSASYRHLDVASSGTASRNDFDDDVFVLGIVFQR